MCLEDSDFSAFHLALLSDPGSHFSGLGVLICSKMMNSGDNTVGGDRYPQKRFWEMFGWLPGLSFLPLIITGHLAFGQDMTCNQEFLRATLLCPWENLEREYYPLEGHLVKARTGLFPECLGVIPPEDVFGEGWGVLPWRPDPFCNFPGGRTLPIPPTVAGPPGLPLSSPPILPFRCLREFS